ncbi:MAG: aspartate aminotransferase [Deltaproteobacteria bacterium CG11_big_fil_rev_8_21_14_0_20_49_13]|nr:MAG: aspartate aminotransferase [Deltaproteobacteria bacterium CG11_big_fil_rev_8_21_14_0_20_49_13]
MNFAKRVEKLKSSPTLALNARAKKMQAEGVNVINFTCGEPDFDTPEHIKKAAHAAITEGFTKYTPVGGIPELKDAVIRAIKSEQGLDYKRDEIIITPGAKYAIFAAMQALISDGDEVLIPAPYWVSYPDQVLLCDGASIIIPTDDKTNFKMTSAALEKSVTTRSKMLILNSPSNPTGFAYGVEELKWIAEVCVKHDLVVISDEIYDGIVFDGFKCKSIASFPGMKERTVLVNGVSKKFAMTGWRMGFAAAPKGLIDKITDIQGQALTNVTSITQKACIAAYDGPTEAVEKMVRAFHERRDVMIEGLNKIGLSCKKPEGSFYAFPDIRPLYGKTLGGKKISTSSDVSEYLLMTTHIATVPGNSFGLDGFIRLSFATSMENIEEGLRRIEKAIC